MTTVVHSVMEMLRVCAEKHTADKHSDVTMSESAWWRLLAERDVPRGLDPQSADCYLFGMQLHVRKTEVGAYFCALMLACVGGKTVLFVNDDCNADTEVWR